MIELTDKNMTSDLYQPHCQSITIGNKKAGIAFYLPNPPIFPDNLQPNDKNFVDNVIELNGNHWRKIFTIMAKIAVKSDQPDAWRAIRSKLFTDTVNLMSTSLFINSKALCPNASLHIVCGQQALDLLKSQSSSNDNIEQAILNAKPIDEKQKIMAHKQILIAPYLDYRQFSNQQINSVKHYISSKD